MRSLLMWIYAARQPADVLLMASDEGRFDETDYGTGRASHFRRSGEIQPFVPGFQAVNCRWSVL